MGAHCDRAVERHHLPCPIDARPYPEWQSALGCAGLIRGSNSNLDSGLLGPGAVGSGRKVLERPH